MTAPTLITLFLIEDQQLECEAIQLMLKGCPNIQVVGVAQSAEQAWQTLEQLNPAIILLDLNLPGSNPFTLIKQLNRRLPTTKVMILTGQKSTTLPDRLLAVGAVGYLTKDQPLEALIAAIELAATGKPVCSPDIAQTKVMQQLQGDTLFSYLQSLSSQEFVVARELAKGASTEEISAMLHLSSKTINCYRHRILKTLKLNSVVDLAYLAVKMGLIDIQSISAVKQPDEQE